MSQITIKEAFLPPPDLIEQQLVVSMVDMPATEQRWLISQPAEGDGFAPVIHLTAPVLLAGQLLWRQTGGQQYWLRYTTEAVAAIAEQFAAMPCFNSMHQDPLDATLVMSRISREAEMFQGQLLPTGSWLITVAIPLAQAGAVLAGRWTGFSLEGTFEIRPVELNANSSLFRRGLKKLGLSKVSHRQHCFARICTAEQLGTDQLAAPAADDQANLEHHELEAMPTPVLNQLWQWFLQLLLGKLVEVAGNAATQAIDHVFSGDQSAVPPPAEDVNPVVPAEAPPETTAEPAEDQSPAVPPADAPTVSVQEALQQLLDISTTLQQRLDAQTQRLAQVQVQLDALAASPAPLTDAQRELMDQQQHWPKPSTADEVWQRLQALRQTRHLWQDPA